MNENNRRRYLEEKMKDAGYYTTEKPPRLYPQNSPKASHDSLLAEVREIIDSLYGRRADDMYNQALDDIKEQLSEFFC